MSSLTKLLQEKRKNEVMPSNLTSSLQAAVVTQQGLLWEQSQCAVSPTTEVQRGAQKDDSYSAITQLDADSDDTIAGGSFEARGPFLKSYIETNTLHTTAPQKPELLDDKATSIVTSYDTSGSTRNTKYGDGANTRSLPSLSSSIPYSLPYSGHTVQGTGNDPSSSVGSANGSSWIEKYGNSLPRNIAAIDTNFISSPKVDSVEPRFVISRHKFNKYGAENGGTHGMSRSNSLSSQLGNFFFTKSSKDNHWSGTGTGGSGNKENLAYERSVPTPIRTQQGPGFGTPKVVYGSYTDTFMESPTSFSEQNISHGMPRTRHSSFADLKRFFKKSSYGSQYSMSPSTPPASAGSVSSQSSNHSSTVTSTSFGSYNADALYNASGNGLSPGLPFSKRYSKLGEKLGAGAGGSVKLVKRLKDNTVFAVKEFRSKYENESKREYIKKITSEYCIGITLNHPNIIATIEIAYDNNRILQVMEYCDYDLFAIVMSNKMSYDEICCCFKQILVGVEYLHSVGLAHRDLKLDNCVINSQGIVKLIDFGAAVVFTYPHSGTLVKASGIVGSDPYLAPEVCIFSKYDPRPVDIWSVAIIFSCLVLKKFPWKIPKLKDVSFKFFCSGRDCDSLSVLVSKTPDPPSYDNAIGSPAVIRPPKSNNPSDPNNPNIGPQRLLHSLPEESQHIIGRMVVLAPACRASIEEIMDDEWVKSIDICHVSDHTGRVIKSSSHSHTQVDQSEAHIAGLEKKKKKK